MNSQVKGRGHSGSELRGTEQAVQLQANGPTPLTLPVPAQAHSKEGLGGQSLPPWLQGPPPVVSLYSAFSTFLPSTDGVLGALPAMGSEELPLSSAEPLFPARAPSVIVSN